MESQQKHVIEKLRKKNPKLDRKEEEQKKAINSLREGIEEQKKKLQTLESGLGRITNAFSIRKTQKDHGIIKWVEGDMKPGDRVVIVDDVATTGGSTIKAIERAQSEGLNVDKAIILVDRQEGGLENIQKHVDASAIITKDDLMSQNI